jgi:hypothetical protein
MPTNMSIVAPGHFPTHWFSTHKIVNFASGGWISSFRLTATNRMSRKVWSWESSQTLSRYFSGFVKCNFGDSYFSPLGLVWNFYGTDRTVIKNTMLAGGPIFNTWWNIIGTRTWLFSFVFVGKKALSIPADNLAASSDYLDRFADTGILTPIPDVFTTESNLPIGLSIAILWIWVMRSRGSWK